MILDMRPWLETWTTHEEHQCVIRVNGGERIADFDWTPANAANVARLRLAAAAPALVRALVSVEWGGTSPGVGAECPACGCLSSEGHLRQPDAPAYFRGYAPAQCAVDAALTAAGLPDQRSRDEARREIGR